MGTSNIDDEIDLDSPDIIYKMDLVVEAFKIMFNSPTLINSENLKNYIKILDQLFVQQIEFADFILSKIAYDLIKCFVDFWQNELNSSENVLKNETIKQLNNFFLKDNNYIECLWKSIGTYLDSTQERKDLQFEKKDYSSVKYINSFIFETIQTLKFCYLFIDLQSNEERVKYYIPIINNLLKIINKLKLN
jgi:G3E family GTPase